MTTLAVLGFITFVILALFIPRVTFAFVVGLFLFGGWWWCLFVPLAIVGLIVDIFALNEAIH